VGVKWGGTAGVGGSLGAGRQPTGGGGRATRGRQATDLGWRRPVGRRAGLGGREALRPADGRRAGRRAGGVRMASMG
jgi:hypothetical protein